MRQTIGLLADCVYTSTLPFYTMKTILPLLCLLLAGSLCSAQNLTTIVDKYTGDTTVSTGFDTLSRADKAGLSDRVVGVRTTHKKQSKYWLFFYFSTSDISQHSVSISKKNFAYFVKTNNEFLRMSYSGKASTYSTKDNAGFFINVTDYISRLQSARIKIIRFETSQLYHEIIVPEQNQGKIADIINSLVE